MVVQDACEVVEQLDKDVAPEPAQPLVILQHGESAASSWSAVSNACISTPVMLATRDAARLPAGAATCLMRRSA